VFTPRCRAERCDSGAKQSAPKLVTFGSHTGEIVVAANALIDIAGTNKFLVQCSALGGERWMIVVANPPLIRV